MGHQRVLQAVVGVALAFATTARDASAAPGERIAVIDLGPNTGTDDAAAKLARAVVAAGFVPVGGERAAPNDDAALASALAGRDVDADAAQLASALATAQRAFGELRCAEVAPAAQQAIGVAAARQAAGLAVPELTRAWAYLLLCADREGQLDAAHVAAHRLRAIGGRPAEVPPAVWAKYPEVDAVANAELVEIDIDTDAPGAVIWIDCRRAGTAPLRVSLPAGEHVIAAAAGGRRGWAAGTAVRTQRTIRVPLTEAAGPWHDVATRVAGWGGKTPSPVELAWLLGRVHARVALVREGEAIAAWGQVGRSELPHLLGGDEARGALGDVDRVLTAARARVEAWSDHAPDPDRPLLTEDGAPPPMRDRRPDDTVDKPTKWWVYAVIGAAAVAGGAIVLFHETGTDRQRVELHYP